ncbi:unnamed protein product [Rhizoctonia solani]|uniref:F-box domain-containing protein n=1 Tax=Rhizoctonia solani TaxID=456999 RepID=A0A8H3GR66_9AGAM|nr:unnamed protein product [Rhizoctonia solani]CAE6461283.1 unnamed protein product [Rhizoctonia solani]
MSSNTRLGDLPVETIASILILCDYRTILRFSATNKGYHRIVCDASNLQLKIELESHGLEIIKNKTNRLDKSTLRELGRRLLVQRSLRHSRHGSWLHVEDMDSDIEIYHYCICHDLYVGAYATVEDPDEPPYDSLLISSLWRNEDEQPLYLNCGTRFSDFVVDPLQKLVVLVKTPYDSLNFAQFDFRSVEDGQPHSLARLPIISIHLGDPTSDLEDVASFINTQTQVANNLLVVGCHWPDTDNRLYEIVIFDWISGVLLGRIYSQTTLTASFVLLDKDYLAVYSATSGSLSKHPDVIALQVYHIPTITPSSSDKNGHFKIASHTSLAPTLILEFPRVQDSLIIGRESLMSADPGVGRVVFDTLITCVCLRVTTLDVRLSLSNPNRYSGIDGLDSQETHFAYYRIYVSTCHIFELLDQQGPGPVTLNWDQWGTRATRWFNGEYRRSPIVGPLCIQWKTVGRRYQKLSSVEFNPLSINAYFTPFPSKSHQNEVASLPNHRQSIHEYRPLAPSTRTVSQEGPSEVEEVRVEMFGTNHKSVFHAGFKEPVESCLPYRVTTQRDRLDAYRTWLIQGQQLMGRSHTVGPLIVYDIY